MYNGTCPKRVAIVGLGPTSLDYIREVDSVGNRYELFDETWTFNSYASVIASDRLFHMDDVRVQELRAEAGNTKVRGTLEALKRYNGPIYTSFPEPEYPNMVKYPLAEVAGRFNSLYFTTTPPYALAFAMFIGVKKVSFYGCDYHWPGVAMQESGRGCLEYWIGRAHGIGMEVNVTALSTLMGARDSTRENVVLYGYDRVTMSIEEREPGKVALILRDKALPSAAEIEARYNHRLPGSEIAVDVVH